MSDGLTLQGAMTAIVTPFQGDQVDWDAFGRLIDEQLAGGIQGLVPCGTTGESPTLSTDEHKKVVEFTVDRVNGRVPVIAGAGSNSTAEAMELTEHAKKAGADAGLIVNPYYNKPTQEGMFRHIQRLGEVGLPIVLYNIPGRTGIELAPETILRMYEEIEMVVAIKEATGKLDTVSELAAECDITILSGDDSLTLPMGAVGGKGVVSVVGNLLPGEIRKLTDAMLAGRADEARRQHLKLFPLLKGMLTLATNPIPIKAALSMAGKCADQLRLPMVSLDDANRDKLGKMLQAFGVDVTG
ncbi:MAG: 4-hydroxy-tetrahydrodipicolinate synthase [Planctomycetota bacterium]